MSWKWFSISIPSTVKVKQSKKKTEIFFLHFHVTKKKKHFCQNKPTYFFRVILLLHGEKFQVEVFFANLRLLPYISRTLLWSPSFSSWGRPRCLSLERWPSFWGWCCQVLKNHKHKKWQKPTFFRENTFLQSKFACVLVGNTFNSAKIGIRNGSTATCSPAHSTPKKGVCEWRIQKSALTKTFQISLWVLADKVGIAMSERYPDRKWLAILMPIERNSILKQVLSDWICF